MRSEPHGKVGSFFDISHINMVILAQYYQKLANVLESQFFAGINAKYSTSYVKNKTQCTFFVWSLTGAEP